MTDLYCDGEHGWFPSDEFNSQGVHTTASPPHHRIGGAPVTPGSLPPAAILGIPIGVWNSFEAAVTDTFQARSAADRKALGSALRDLAGLAERMASDVESSGPP
jgi:hypothetical protein